MLRRIFSVFVAGVLFSIVTFCSGGLYAAEKNITRMSGKQQNPIHAASKRAKSGKLTKEEAKALMKTEKDIKQMKKDAKADGVVTPEERKAIMDQMKAMSKEIDKQKYDSENK